MGEYTYTPLQPGQIRLLHILPAQSSDVELIECSLSHHDFNDNQYALYTALSYTWGDTDGGRDILIDDKRMYARPNLHACLHSLRHYELSYYVWIDAICINQRDEDNDEKSAQLRLMGEIYSKAECVAICLKADSIDEENEFFDTVNHYRQHYDHISFPTVRQDHHKIYQAVQWLCRNPYFSRMWIVQENVLAANRTLICGSRKISWLYVERIVGESAYTTPEGVSPAKHSQLIRDSGIDHVSGLNPHHVKAMQEPPAPTLFGALVRYRQQQCFDRRDKVFALLGLPEMRKPKIQKVCHADYKRDVQDLLLDILEWFESSPALTARHQTQLQRYELLQGTLQPVDLSTVSCRPLNTGSISSIAECRFDVRFGTGRMSKLPIVFAEASYKGRISSATALQNVDVALEEIGGLEEEVRRQNLQLLEELQCGLSLKRSAMAFRPESEENVLRLLRECPEESQSVQCQQRWKRVVLSTGGWGIASEGVEVDDIVYTVIIGQTQNNTGINCSLVVRETGGGLFSLVGLALDHLGFVSRNRQRPSPALGAPMPPRANKGDRQNRLQMVMDPVIAFRITSPTSLKTLGYGWRTTQEMAW
ncbi:heterokaryon incompatibility protein-domain-containing protein [Hypoxylon crocopeplum]|nr:heterokaryon incompatibility protein-domain-containing protein [Hypoxylon crocopeplum]